MNTKFHFRLGMITLLVTFSAGLFFFLAFPLPTNVDAASNSLSLTDVTLAMTSTNSTIYLPLLTREKDFDYDPTLPRLVLPKNGAQLDTIIPLFVFETGTQPPGTAGVLDFSTNPDPNRPTDWWASFSLESNEHRELQMSYNLQPNTTYYWRVGVIYNYDYSQPPRWTEQCSFTTTPTGGVILPAPTLISPINGTAVDANNLVLQWIPVSGAIEYDITVHNMDTDRWYGFSSTTTQLIITDSFITPGHHYEWFVTPRNNYAWGTQSEQWEFSVSASTNFLSWPVQLENFVVLKSNKQTGLIHINKNILSTQR